MERPIDQWIRPSMAKLKPYTSARDEYGESREDMIFLDANENPFDSGMNRYPDPLQRELKERISRWRNVAPERILLGNGSDEVLDLLFRLFCVPEEDRVVVLPPTYGMYSVLAAINSVETLEIPLDNKFEPNVPAILECNSDKTKMVFICSPNNPTANLMPRDSIIRLLEGFDGIVVVDEAYIDFTDQESLSNLLDIYSNLVVVQTFSKAMGLAGIRLGMLFAREELIKYLNAIKPPYNVNGLTQKAALNALGELDSKKEQVAILKSERAWLARELDKIDCVREVLASEANFILARVDDADILYRYLIGRGIVVRNRSKQLNCDNTLRFTVGTPTENKVLIEALKKF